MEKILVANRGEIAIRVMRSAREMGIETVAVFSEADRNALHVQMADEAILIGPAASAQSYLKIDNIIEAAKKTGADAIHPGYGFLSENAEFAKKVEDAGITFIGPNAKSIDIMGNKLSAKAAARKYNIPLLPGTHEPVKDTAEAARIAVEIGFPVLIKAAAGGGGKGMRVVHEESEFPEQLERAQSEARSAFGDESVFLEKYITSPKHIEVQVMADTHGNIVYLFERECSIQRRHQKVIEEAPSKVVTPEIRKSLGENAVNVARSCNYVGAGTVEFIMDENRDFFFLEMNTRLQVEHPVTEMITGRDLVKDQIRIARGEKLSFTQDDLKIQGHAIELRVYAEDPLNNFLPDTGKLRSFKIPNGLGVRTDSGYVEGMEIPVHYDPMIAKLVVHDVTREAAIEKMNRAIDEFDVDGIATTLPFGRFVMGHQNFIDGSYTTHFVEKFFKPEYLPEGHEDEEIVAAITAVIASANEKKSSQTQAAGSEGTANNWLINRRDWR